MDKIVKTLTKQPSIVLCCASVKRKLIELLEQEAKKENTLSKTIIKTFKEFKEDLFPSIDFLCLFNNLQNEELDILKIKLENSLLLIGKDISNLENETSTNSKTKKDTSAYDTINELVDLKNKNNFSINPLLLSFYKRHKVYVLNYDNTDDLVNKGLAILENAEYLEIEQKNFSHEVKYFEDYQKEIIYIVAKIQQLLRENVDPKKIIIHKPNDEYIIKFREIFNLFKISYDLNDTTSLYDLFVAKEIMHKILMHKGKLVDAIKKVAEEMKNEEEHTNEKEHADVKAKVFSALSVFSYFDFDCEKAKKLVKFVLENTSYKAQSFANVIKFDDVFSGIYDDEHIFIPSFSQDVVPSFIKDTKYLSDELREKLNLVTSTKINEQKNNQIITFFKNTKNVHITCSQKSTETTFITHSLLDEFLRRKKNKENIKEFITVAYEEKNDKVLPLCTNIELSSILSKNLVHLQHLKNEEAINIYGAKTDENIQNDYGMFYDTFSDMPKYNNEFKIDHKDVFDKFGENLKVSYSAIDEYVNCPFNYYVKYVLRIKERSTDDTHLLVGNLFHYVLENLVNDFTNKADAPTKIDELIESFKTQERVTLKQEFFLNKFKGDLLEVWERIYDYLNEGTDFSVYETEKEIQDLTIYKGVTLDGKIDLILQKDNHFVVIDYKTGNSSEVSLDTIDKGLNLQIPIYWHLIKKEFPESKIAGGYLFHVFDDKLFKYDKEHSYTKKDFLLKQTLFNGYTLKDQNVALAIDKYNGIGVKILRNQVLKKDGNFSTNFLKKALEEKEFEKVIEITKAKVQEVIEKILKNEFSIKPLKIKSKNDACEYCKYKCMCYVLENSVKYEKAKTLNELLNREE